MKKTLYFLALLIFTNSSVAQNSGIKLNKRKLKKSIKSFITSQLQSNYKPVLGNKILQKPTVSDIENLSDFFSSDYFYFIHKLNIKSKEEIIKFDEFFSEGEFKSMRMQIQNNKHKNWTELIGKKHINSINKKLTDKVYYSIPVFNKDFSFAVVYLESSDSGELRVFKHENNKWVLFGVGGLWTSD